MIDVLEETTTLVQIVEGWAGVALDEGTMRELLDFVKAIHSAERARAEMLEELLHQFSKMPNDIRYQMGTTFGSTPRDEAYAKGWNDLRVKIGREMLERLDATLADATDAPAAAGGPCPKPTGFVT
jgi:hypothetical protein